MSKAASCWCGGTHPDRTDDPTEAIQTLWHLMLTEMRIPQLVDWLSRRLGRRR